MTPLQLSTLCNIYSASHCDTFHERAAFLTENGLIQLTNGGCYICTSKGASHVRQLSLIELPKDTNETASL